MSKLIYTLFMASTITLPAHASHLLNLINHKSLHRVPAKHVKSPHSIMSNHYTDFSGSWKGVCQSNNQPADSIALTIKNDAYNISILNEEDNTSDHYEIEATQSYSYSIDGINLFNHEFVQWNNEQNELHFLSNQSEFSAYNPPMYNLVELVMSLKQEQLLLDIQVLDFENLDALEPLHVTCALNKQ